MTKISLLPCLILALSLVACNTDPQTSGPVAISIRQALTGETTAGGTFEMTGVLTDQGQTTEEVTFGGPLNQSPVPITFRRTLIGARGSIVVRGAASLAFSSPTAATFTGTWEVESGTGEYAALSGTGSLSGSADFGVAPPTAVLSYSGTVGR